MDNFNAFYWKGDIQQYYLGHQFSEIFKDKIYDPYFVNKKELTVLDLGANLGVFSLYASKYAKIIHSFEPALEAYSCLEHMVSENKLTNIVPHKVAISNTDGEATFYHYENKTMNSLTPVAPTPDTEIVKTIRLDTFLKENNIDHVDFCKTDTEGNEYDIYCGDGFANVADKFSIIMGEIHNWAGRNPQQLKDAFKINGFSFEILPNEAEIFIAKHL